MASERLGPHANPQAKTAGELSLAEGGLTVWDSYVIAAIPAIVSRVNNLEPEQWASVGAAAAMVADLALAERKKREAANVG